MSTDEGDARHHAHAAVDEHQLPVAALGAAIIGILLLVVRKRRS